MIARLAIAAALSAGLCACGAQTMSEPPPGGEPLTLGTLGKDGAFAPLSDGQDVTLVEGAQGGFHVWMNFQAVEMPPADAVMRRTAHRLSDGKLVLRTQSGLTIPETNGPWQLPMAVPMFMCPSPVGLSVIDQPIVYAIDIATADGTALGHGEITLVPHCPTDSATSQAFCQRICVG